MIPKIIHYCWFGHNKKNRLIKKCINSWKNSCSNFQIIEWNEDNFDLNNAPLYVKQAYESKKWAFVSDYVRLYAVYNYGGIYLDTDVELLNNINSFIDNKGFFAFEDERYICTGLGFAAEKKDFLVKELMDCYNNIAFIKEDGTQDLFTCPKRNEPIFIKYGLICNGKTQFLSTGHQVYDRSYFSPMDWKTKKYTYFNKNTVAIHHYAASWLSPIKKIKMFLKRIIF